MKHHLLIVEDRASHVDFMRAILEEAGYAVTSASDGRSALEKVRHCPPDLVITDLKMPGMDGFALTAALRKERPQLPVLLTTGAGSEEAAARALREGAVSYLPKRRLEEDLASTAQRILNVVEANCLTERLEPYVSVLETEFSLGNDESLTPHVVRLFQSNLRRLSICDENGLLRIATALDEALVNAMYHGNLEVSSQLREQKGGRAFLELANERRQIAPYKDRTVRIRGRATRSEAVFVVRDEGPGFNPADVPDPTNPENLDRIGGRGLLLIHAFMDEVAHNDQGNEITMIKRRESP